MTRSRLAWSLAALDAAIFFAFSLVVDPRPDYIAVAAYAVGITSFVVVGALLITRVPANPIGGLLLAAGTLLATASALLAYANLASLPSSGLPASAMARSFSDAFFIYPIVIALIDIPLVYPDGRLPSPRFRWVTLASILLLIGWTIGATLKTDVVGLIVLVSMLVSFVGAVIAVTLRFRRGNPVERQQVKGLAATVLVAGAFFPIGFLIFNANPALSNAVIGVGLLALFALPVVIGLAILRYRLYEIDRIISRTLAYVLITGLLVGAYAALVVILGGPLAGATGGDTLSVALSTLVVAALFQPLRRRVQSLVDRRFDRARYDGQRLADAFAGRLRNEVDITTISADLDVTVRAAVRPTTAGLWVRGRQG